MKKKAATRKRNQESRVVIGLPEAVRQVVLPMDDLALAATEVSNRVKSVVDEEPPTRRTGKAPDDSDGEKAMTSSYGGRVASTTSLREQLGEEKKRRGGAGLLIAGAVVLGAGAWILWPRPADTKTTSENPPATSASATAATADAALAASDAAPATSASVMQVSDLPDASVLELDPALADLDAGAGRSVSSLPSAGPHSLPSLPPPTASTASTRKINAWSILTDASLVPMDEK